jgi:hypothetical protein
MTPFDWLNAAIIVAAVGAWTYTMVQVAEWRDLHADRARARQQRMHPVAWVKTNTIAAISPRFLFAVWLVGAVAIAWFIWTWPVAKYALIVPLGVHGLRHLNIDPDDIRLLRDALGQIIGVDSRQRPPKVTTGGEHTAGGPQYLTIAGHPGFQYWEKTKREKVEAAIEATMPGDWENTEWQGDGTSVWERLPELPGQVDYTAPIDDLEWYQLPVGIDGAGEVAVADLSEHPHWFVAGSTGFGKTSWLRVAAAHLLHHRIQVAAIDINYAGLAFLEGRPGVTAAMDTFEQIEDTVAALRTELRNRLTQLKQDRTYRPPLVIVVDELEVLCDRAKATGHKPRGAKEPQLVADLLEIARTGRKVDMHLILATQRPEGKTIPTSLRDNALGRLAVGPLSQQSAQMVLDQQWARAVNTPKVKGRTVLRCGDWQGWVQGYWLADPDEQKHDPSDRSVAASLLPARMLVRPSHIVSEPLDVPTKAQAERSDGGKRGSETIFLDESVNVARPVSGTVKETDEERRVRLKREVLHNPNDPRHGRQVARQTAGCICAKCRPELVEVDAS